MAESAEALLRKRAMESMLRKKSDTTSESRPIEPKGAPLPPPASAPPAMLPVRAPADDKEDGEIEDDVSIAPSESALSAGSETASKFAEMANAAEGVSFAIKSTKPITVKTVSNLDVGGQNPLSEGVKTTSILEGSAKVVCMFCAALNLNLLHFNSVLATLNFLLPLKTEHIFGAGVEGKGERLSTP